MSSKPDIIADRLQVPQHPTVVRLDDLGSGAASWISDSYFITGDVKNHLHALNTALGKENGTGIFLIGHFGSGKSHFLAYLIQQLGRGLLAEGKPNPVYLSLVNFSADHSLESIISKQLDIQLTQDRRDAFGQLQLRHPDGVLLVLDELSEFLRSKTRSADFTEDIRFLQFLGEWAQGNKFWIIAAMQEQIEHTGDLDHSLYRKIKDRYPLRFLLTTVHVRDLISQTLLQKKPGYDDDVLLLAKDLVQGLPPHTVDLKNLVELYPLHPVTLEFLEEIRDCFSQARGIVEFVVTQLHGHDERQIKPFLQQPWGELLTPDCIVDHFEDLFEIQPEFVPLSNQCMAWYRQNLDSLFDPGAPQKLARQLIKLLMLVYISPTRNSLQPVDAVYWLMFRATRLDADKNVALVKRALDVLVDKGRFVECSDNHYRLNLKENTQAELANHVQRARDQLPRKPEQVFELLTELLDNKTFNPFVLPRNEWQSRSYRWHFHERKYKICLGDQVDNEPTADPLDGCDFYLVIGLPWQPTPVQTGCALMQPATLELLPQWLELAAMLKVLEQPLANKAKQLLSRQIQERSALFHSEIRQAYQQSILNYDGLKVDQNLMLDASKPFTEMIEQVINRMLRRRYPSFERFAPSYGPLPRENWLSFLRQGLSRDLFALEADDATQLVHEAYLLPMGLVKRTGRYFGLPASLDRHELVGNLLTMIEHEPEPAIIYKHFAEPVYGLVADQVRCLLYLLLIQGEIDIMKGNHSLRDHFETLLDPRQYDKIVIANALGEQEITALLALLEALGLKAPTHNTVSAQRKALDQLRAFATDSRRELNNLAMKLPDSEQAFKHKLASLVAQWRILDQGDTPFQGWQQFLFEVESVNDFSNEINQLSGMPDQINHLLSELGRYQHIQSHFEQQQASLPHFEAPPSLADPDAFKLWIRHTTTHYQAWCEQYTREHDAWWAEQEIDGLMKWQPLGICSSKHLSLVRELEDYEQTRKRLADKRCTQIDKLIYQPYCHCGFVEGKAPIEDDLKRLEQLKKIIEDQTKRFFQQKNVRQRVVEWQQQGLECNQTTQDYIANKAQWPEVQDITLFDSYLSGVEVTHTIDADDLVKHLCHQPWTAETLGFALQQWAHGFREFASIRIEKRESMSSNRLLEWVTKQVLHSAARVPESLNSQEQKTMTEIMRAEWVRPGLWQSLDDLGLQPDAVARLLAWVMDGTLSELPKDGLSPSVKIAQDIGRVIEIDNPGALAVRAAELYSKHELFMQANPEAWLQYLDNMARFEFPSPLPDLKHYLASNPPSQWLVLDAFGLPLLPWIKDKLPQWLPGWEISAIDFIEVSIKTTTDEFYRSLLDSETASTFTKINTIDEQIHGRFLPFADLQNVLAAEIPIALNAKVGGFRKQDPLLISGDHGFRISRDGKRYEHGGSSTLERVIPVVQMTSGPCSG